MLVRIEKVGRSAAQASLVDPPEGIVPSPAESESTSNGRRRRRGRRGGRGRRRKAESTT
jgi:hypothetical protein